MSRAAVSSRGCRAAAVARAAVAVIALALGVAAHADTVVQDARARAVAGDVPGALQSVRAWLDAHPDDPDAQFLHAQLLGWSRDYEASRRAFDALIERSPRDADCLFGRAQVTLWSGRPVAALIDIAAVRALQPDYPGLDELQRQAQAAAAVPVAVSAPGAAPEPTDPAWEIMVGAAHDDLDSGYDDWSAATVRLQRQTAPQFVVRAGLSAAGRYGEEDVETQLGGSWLAAGRWDVGGDVTAVSGADFLPVRSVQLHAQRFLTPTLSVRGSARHAEYTSSSSDVLSVTLEKYTGRLRFAYSLFRGAAEDAEATYSHVLRADLAYRDRDWIGVQFVTGRESESDGAGGLVNSDVTGATLLGRHSLRPEWSLAWAVTWQEQGDTYQRVGLDVGLVHRF